MATSVLDFIPVHAQPAQPDVAAGKSEYERLFIFGGAEASLYPAMTGINAAAVALAQESIFAEPAHLELHPYLETGND